MCDFEGTVDFLIVNFYKSVKNKLNTIRFLLW